MGQKLKRRKADTSSQKATPEQARHFYNLSIQSAKKGQHTEALKYGFLAHKESPKNHHYRLYFVHLLKNASLKEYSPEIKTCILKLLSSKGIDYQNLWRPWLSILLCDPHLTAFQNLYHGNSYDGKELQNNLKDPFIQQGLEKFIVFDMQFERALQKIHHDIENQTIFAKQFAKSLTLYNQLTEGLIYPLSAKEIGIEISQDIQTLSLPENQVHQNVRAQYEDNPYPRWVSCDVLPDSKVEDDKTGTHLIAGCGTGYGTCLTALRYPNKQITAIDLSLASLSYAQKKVKELGIKNITFYQADILDLSNLDQTFDSIECSGVLHHMEAPLKGWQALSEKLKPDGRMHIGLYSKIARQDIIEGRALISKEAIGLTPDGIKSAREMIAHLPGNHIAKNVLSRRDFYSLSSCRDLLFHVQEKCYTIEELINDLKALNLEFEGFEIDHSQTLQKFSAKYPDDPQMLHLENWKEYEENNPDTFRGMYQFWCKLQK